MCVTEGPTKIDEAVPEQHPLGLSPVLRGCTARGFRVIAPQLVKAEVAAFAPPLPITGQEQPLLDALDK